MRPLFPYYGSKWNMARYYPKPSRALVIEPFAGSAGYSLFHDCRKVMLFDADPVIAGLWEYLINVSEAEVLNLPLLPNKGDSLSSLQIPQEAKWLIGFWLNRGSASPKMSRTAYSARSDRGQLNWGERARARVAAGLSAVRDWTVKCAPYLEAPDVEATWHIDPPYENKGKFYRVPFKAFQSLGPWCQARRGQVMACENEGASWLPFQSLGSFKSSKGRSQEVVYFHDTDFAAAREVSK